MNLMRNLTIAFGVGIASLGVVQAQGIGAGRAVDPARVQCLATSAQEAEQALSYTNAVRTQRGLAGLRINRKLVTAAARHACDMARRQRLTHVGSSTKGPGQRVKAAGYRQSLVAENIAVGFDTAARVSGAWVGSGGHLSNILLPQVQEFGIGKAVAADGQVFWAAVYAAPR